MICQEAGQETEQQRRFQPSGLQPLIIPQDPTSVEQNPFSTDPRNEQSSSAGSQDMVDADGVPSGPFHQLNLTSRSIDESCESGYTSRSPTFSSLSRSQSELRASPLRKCVFFTSCTAAIVVLFNPATFEFLGAIHCQKLSGNLRCSIIHERIFHKKHSYHWFLLLTGGDSLAWVLPVLPQARTPQLPESPAACKGI